MKNLNVVHQFFSKFRQHSNGEAKIALDQLGIDVVDQSGNKSRLDWADVQAIEVMVIDNITSDSLAISFVTSPEDAFQIYEDIDGFWDVVDSMEKLFEIEPKNWKEVVLKRAFFDGSMRINSGGSRKLNGDM